MVDYVVFGRGSFNQLDEILVPRRKGDAPMIFLVDHFFEGKPLAGRVPLRGKDKIVFVDVTYEPKTTQVDKLAKQLKDEFGTVSGIIGIGGGSTMDLAKAVSLMMNNPGSSADYQGWDLVKFPGVYKAGIPTLSGTGAEVSRTTVLTGPTRKLGMNSDFTPFDQIVLDPELTTNAPVNQRFYTGMDCYIHCIESLEGTYLNEFSKSYGEKARELCLLNSELFQSQDLISLYTSLPKLEQLKVIELSTKPTGFTIMAGKKDSFKRLGNRIAGNLIARDDLPDPYPRLLRV